MTMTHAMNFSLRRTAPAAALAALLLAGCTSGHVGESWQCPLAEGGTCDSVAAADPAVPDMDAARKAVLAAPFYTVRDRERTAAPARAPCETDCETGFDPFGWLARLLGADPETEVEAGDGGDIRPAAAAAQRTPNPAPDARTAAAIPGPANAAIVPAASPPSAEGHESRSAPAEPATATLPAEPPASVEEGPRGGDLRTGEVVARIWIGPFVDGNGVYREASHVRVVLEPAGWRLP